MIAKGFIRCSERCEKIRSELVQAVPAIEVDRAYYLTQSPKRQRMNRILSGEQKLLKKYY